VKYEFNTFVRCKKFNTALQALREQLIKDNQLEQSGIDTIDFNNPECATYNNNKIIEYHDFFEGVNNEVRYFFRIQLEQREDNLYYIDIGYSI
jgi:hypothetical protein